jgi:uncharacterized protein (TIGR02246 family)
MQEDDNQAREVVEKINQQFSDAISKQDAAAIAQLYTEDALVFVEGKEIKGREAIQKGFQEYLDGGVAEASFQVTEAKSLGDLAYGLGTSVSRDSQGKVISGSNWMEIYKQEGGMWKIHRDTIVSRPKSESMAGDGGS